MACARDPAIMVNPTVTKHLKVLGCMPVLGFGVVKSINHLRSIERNLSSALHYLCIRQTHCLRCSRCIIFHVTKLRAALTLVLDSFGPMHHHSVAGAAPM